MGLVIFDSWSAALAIKAGFKQVGEPAQRKVVVDSNKPESQVRTLAGVVSLNLVSRLFENIINLSVNSSEFGELSSWLLYY